MAYEKQTWATGDIITAEKMNHLEEGVASGDALIVRGFSYGANNSLVGTSDRTWQEIHDALAAGARCVVVYTIMDDPGQMNIMAAALVQGKYKIFGDNDFGAETTSADGYPTAGGSPNN